MSGARRPVAMPSVEVGMEQGRVVEFLVEVGSPVALGQPLFVVEAETVTIEIEAPAAGRVAELCAEPDTDVAVGSPVLVLDVG
jgi:pyruvate/2-oxoglutarate dehydrogenase complex dihydrolipoamide acyltransferase (E2) component